MKYFEIIPDPPLDTYIQCFTVVEGSGGLPEYILPDGIVELVFHFGDPMVTTGFGVQPVSFAISQMKKPIEIHPAGTVGYVSARFYPWGAYHFFTMAIQDFVDGTVAARHLWPQEISRVEEQIALAITSGQRLQCLRRFLLMQLERNSPDPSLDQIIRYARYSGWSNSVADMGRVLGFSKKRLERIFKYTVGTSPKVFLRNARFLHACQIIRESRARDLTSVAFQLGYYDQAHFIHDFQHFSGMTPGEFVRREDLNFTSLT